jgi:Flp pilus assembly protein TadD
MHRFRPILYSMLVSLCAASAPAWAQGVEDLYDQGYKAYLKRQFGEAASYLNTVLSTQPNHARAHNLMGKIYHRGNKMQLAVGEYNKAIEADARYAEPHFNMGVAYYDQGNYKEAERSFDEAVRLDNSN